MWTTTKPTTPGWYWYRTADDREPRIIHVYSSCGLPLDATFTGNDGAWTVEELTGEFWSEAVNAPDASAASPAPKTDSGTPA
jgi:hypothetical protein